MAFVSVPRDLSRVKNKVAFNLTRRQILCILPTALLGLGLYFLTRDFMGVTNAATVMVLVMVPGFLFGLYEKDGLYLEQVLRHRIRVRYLRPHSRPYVTRNRYADPAQTPEERRRSPLETPSSRKKPGKTGTIPVFPAPGTEGALRPGFHPVSGDGARRRMPGG